MILIATLQAGVETAFGAASELVRLGTYTSRGGDPVYDPVTDAMTGGSVTVANVRMLQTALTTEEREASPVAINDVKFLIPFIDLPGVTPSDTGVIVLDGVGYNVTRYRMVPGQAIHIVFARRK